MQDALAVHRALLEHGVPHEVVRLPRGVHDADELPDVLGVDAACCAVVRCYVTTSSGPGPAETVLHAVVVPAGTQPEPRLLRAVLASESLRDATPTEINLRTDYPARLVSAVGLRADVPVLLDTGLDLAGTVWTSTGENGTVIALHGADLPAVTGGRLVNLVGAAVRKVIDLTAVEAGTTTVKRTPRDGHSVRVEPRDKPPDQRRQLES